MKHTIQSKGYQEYKQKTRVMAKQLITLAAFPKGPSSVLTIILGGSQLPVAPAPRDLALCSDLCGTERTEPHT